MNIEIAILITDKISTDPVKHNQLPKAGDVIEWLSQGSHWGESVINSPDFRIIRVIGLTEHQAEALKGVQVSNGTQGQLLQFRQIRVDLARLFRNHPELHTCRQKVWTKYNYKTWHPDLVTTVDDFLPLHSLKPRLKLPTHIGPDDNVIG